MIGVVTSRSRNLYLRPPMGPYCLNQDCAQAQGLAAWYPLSGRGSDAYREYVRRQDLPLSLTGTMAVVPGPGGALAVSNTGVTTNYLSQAAPIVTATPLTLGCWFYPANLTDSCTLVVVLLLGALDNYWSLLFDGSIGGDPVMAETAKETDGNYQNATTTTSFVATTWQHACGVFLSATSRSAYLNGGGKATNTTSCIPTSVDEFQVGVYNASGTAFGTLNGAVAHVCLWSRALGDGEVLALYDPETRWELYYPLGRKTTVFLGDYTGVFPPWPLPRFQSSLGA